MLLDKVRAATSALHTEVEQLVGAEKMQDGTFSIPDYANYLLASHRFHCNIETAFRPHAAAIPYGSERIKTPAIAQDLLKVQITPGEYAQQLGTNSLAATMGYLYVSEGSMLGAQIIYKSLLNIPRIHHLDAFQFLTLYNKRTGVLWSSFIELMKTGVEEEEHQVTVDAAVEAFLLFREIYQTQQTSVK